MDNYTVTFKYDGDFDLPNEPDKRDKSVPGLVLQKLEAHEFELIDFNLTENYQEDYAENYITDPYLHRCILEIKTNLTRKDLQSREAIYNRCLTEMKKGELKLCRAYENENASLGMLQSIVCFEADKQEAA
jgi:hypothetical protein